jgi:hypothetical protein
MDLPLPPELAAALRPVLPELAEETIVAIGQEVPDYARPLEGPFGHALRAGVERALTRFVDEIEAPGAPDEQSRRIYVQLGRAELRAGRSLDALLSAYRLGARLAWERFVAAAEAAGHEPRTLYALAGAIFTYIDAISAESVAGFSAEQTRAAGERARRRRALVRLLARDDAAPEELRDLAVQAAWPVPAAIAALVVTGTDPDRLAARLDAEALAVADGETGIVLLPDPDAPGMRARLVATVGDVPAALGPSVDPERAHHSVSRARAAHRLLAEGRLPAGRLAVADEHLLGLLLHGDDATLAAEFSAVELAPLAGLGEGPRARLTRTLRAWLDHPGQVQRVAGELHVHPQTVRYRMRALRELFGDALEDPERRFALGIALRVGQPAGIEDPRPAVGEYGASANSEADV